MTSDNTWDEFENTGQDAGAGTNKKIYNRIDFKDSMTQIRLLSNNGIKRFYHFIRTGNNRGKPVICCGKECPVCLRGNNKPSPKWLFPALERSTLKVGVVQLPITAMKSIAVLRKLPMYGPNVMEYDIVIVKTVTYDSNNKKNTRYSAQGIPKGTTEKLSDDVKASIKRELDALDMESVAKPYSPEQTLRYLGWDSPQPQQSQPQHQEEQVQSTVNPAAMSVPPSDSGESIKSVTDNENINISSFLNTDSPSADESFAGPVDQDSSGQDDEFGDDPLEF